MSHSKQAPKRKRRGKAVPMVGIAGVSLAMAGGASAATAPTANLPSQATAPLHEITLGEEEISDVSLATFYVFDKEDMENAEAAKSGIQVARGCGGRGCGGRGCGGRGCGGRGCGGRCGGGCGGRCGCWGGCGCGCCLSWGGCGLC